MNCFLSKGSKRRRSLTNLSGLLIAVTKVVTGFLRLTKIHICLAGHRGPVGLYTWIYSGGQGFEPRHHQLSFVDWKKEEQISSIENRNEKRSVRGRDKTIGMRRILDP